MTSAPEESPREHLHGLDWARAVFAIAVVAWHAQALGDSSVFRPGAHPDVAGVVYLNGLVLAVPVFLVMSLYLYARTWRPDTARLARRLVDLLVLAAFWIALTWMTRGIGELGPGGAIRFVVSGGGTVFYFLVELAWLTVVLDVLLRLGARRHPAMLVIVTAACGGVMLLEEPLAARLPGDAYFLEYWSPLNFLPYAPAAALIATADGRPLSQAWVLGLGALLVVLAVGEWILLGDRGFVAGAAHLPAYSRPSLVVSAALVVALLVRVRRPSPRLVVWLSGLSLGIYVVHRLVLDNAASIWPSLHRELDSSPFLLFVVVLAATVAIVWTARSRRVL